MILPDVNLLLYAHDENSEFYLPAVKWLENVMENEQIFLSWHTITGFIRIITHPSASVIPFSIEDAVSVVDEWLARENVHLISLEKKNWPLFSRMLIDGQATGNLVMDAHLAAMSASCGATLATTDRDFSRFFGIKIINPLKP